MDVGLPLIETGRQYPGCAGVVAGRSVATNGA